MYKQGKRDAASMELRTQAGLFIKSLRTNQSLTQREVAVALKLNYYTMISQIENGAARIPPDLYVAYAKVLKVDTALFVRKLLQYYDPHTYKALYGSKRLTLADFLVEES